MTREEFGDERRKLRPRADDERLVDSVVYYGLGQVFLCCVPVLWLIFQSPVQRVDLVTGAVVAMIGCVGTIGVQRAGLVEFGPAWPRIDQLTLGVGDGYARLLTRGTVLSNTLALSAFGAAAVGAATRQGWPVVAWALGASTASVLAFPVLSRRTARAALARLGYGAIALAVVGAVGAPLDVGVGFGTGAVVYAGLVLATILDGGRTIVERGR